MNTPDSIQIEALDVRALCKRRKRFRTESASTLELIPTEWRELLTRWIKRGGNSRWETLLKDAGTTNLALADTLREWLLRQGWCSVTEEREHGEWWPRSIELRNLPKLRAALGISDKEQDARHWQAVREQLSTTCTENLSAALLALDKLPVHRALARFDLLAALQRWQDAQRSGTRRDFALFARDDTKGLSDAEWNWLGQTLDLAEFNIERHTPLLLLSASLTLNTMHGQLDLGSCTDFAALTPATMQAVTTATGTVNRWQLVENRTSFERVARQRETEVGVIWLPGFPPSWWINTIGQLLNLSPAPAYIACDPDPAGISIALKASEPWVERRIAWHPWKMNATDLASLRAHKQLTEVDKIQLASMQNTYVLPAPLAELAEWMIAHEKKGEQEGYL